MADLEVDQSKLPNVQEVRQCFAVLEDGALAHNLQEQEIEQYYCSNVQRSQLVQNDIRVAKRLQDEEQQRAFMLHRQATLKLEEQDSKYARRVQEEIQRCADEAQRREAEDEEIARQIQEEEELRIRECHDYQNTNTVKADAPAPSHALRPSRPAVAEEDERCRRASFSSSCSSSSSSSDYEEERRDRSRRVYEDCGEPEVHSVQPTRVPRRRSSLGHESQSSSHSNRTGPFQGRWGDVVKLIKTDLNEQGYLGYSSGDELFEPIYKLERVLSQRQQGLEPCGENGKRLAHHSRMREGCVRTWQGEFAENFRKFQEYNDGRRVMAESRQVRRYNSSCSDSRPGERQRHVHFQDDRSGLNGYKDSRRGFGGIRERGSHYHGYHTAASCQYHLQTQVSHQSAQVRQVNPDVHRRRSMAHENHESRVAQISEEEYEDPDSLREQRREGCGRRIIGQCRQRAHYLREERRWDRRGSERVYRGEQSGRRVRREHWQGYEEERSSTDEEEVERERERRREERRTRRLPKRSLSLSCRGRSSRAGAPLARDGASLHLGELEQVLLDEELARRLQQEEEKLLRRELPASSTLLNPYPEGDFRVAQVAQDEEIAHFMQKQEIRAKRCSQDQERCGSGQEYQDTAYHNDGRCRQMQMQRERLDSEGLLSPTEEDCSPEHQPSSPITMPVQAHHFRNIAEELDPTFQRKGHVHAAPNASAHCQIQASPQDEASSRVLAEEPAFVAPTKRPNEKPGRVKSREKKDSPKLKENCKQQ